MSTFKKYKKIRSMLSEFPGVKTYKEFDILIEIGYHQEQGNLLSVKQLMLLQIASRSTLRRYLGNLVRDGLVKKTRLDNDHRSVVLELSGHTIKMLTNHLARIVEYLKTLHEMEVAKPTGKKKKP